MSVYAKSMWIFVFASVFMLCLAFANHTDQAMLRLSLVFALIPALTGAFKILTWKFD